jgi:CheY-like chemotaxis protein
MLKEGFAACLYKPFRQSKLFETLLVVCGGPEAAASLKQSGANRLIIQRKPSGEVAAKILVAEDNPVNQHVARLLLQELGFEATIVSNGDDAVNAVLTSEFAVVFMDCQMPRMDGFEATRLIRSSEGITQKRVPIIAMTAQAMEGDRERCMNAGMDDYLSKPITSAKLKEVVERWTKTDESATKSPNA